MMEGYDIFTTRERAKWIAEKIIDFEVPYETEPWKSAVAENKMGYGENAIVRIIVPQEHSLLLDYLIGRAVNEIDDPSDL